MTINIEKMRADMRWETRKFILQLVVGLAAVATASAAVTVAVINYIGKVH